MKQILPFKKELLFKTKVSEITSISLEHTLSLKKDDLISGEFIITGDYKMTEGSINREKFKFKLPFDIALDSRYDMDSIMIDIDNFYYEIINNESLKVNIDVYVEGEKIEEQPVEDDKTIVDSIPIIEKDNIIEETLIEDKTIEVFSNKKEDNKKEDRSQTEEIIDLFKEKYTPSVDVSIPKKIVMEGKNNLEEFNLFDNIESKETYVTYYVYIVKEEDTVEKIMEKYNVTRESLEHYNKLDNITMGMKLIIPGPTNE